MKIPGFNAEASLHDSGANYVMANNPTWAGPRVTMAQTRLPQEYGALHHPGLRPFMPNLEGCYLYCYFVNRPICYPLGFCAPYPGYECVEVCF